MLTYLYVKIIFFDKYKPSSFDYGEDYFKLPLWVKVYYSMMVLPAAFIIDLISLPLQGLALLYWIHDNSAEKKDYDNGNILSYDKSVDLEAEMELIIHGYFAYFSDDRLDDTHNILLISNIENVYYSESPFEVEFNYKIERYSSDFGESNHFRPKSHFFPGKMKIKVALKDLYLNNTRGLIPAIFYSSKSLNGEYSIIHSWSPNGSKEIRKSMIDLKLNSSSSYYMKQFNNILRTYDYFEIDKFVKDVDSNLTP